MIRWSAGSIVCLVGLAWAGAANSAERAVGDRDRTAATARSLQPLPSEACSRAIRRGRSSGRTIIIVSGKGHKISHKIVDPGGPVSLNPQPLPPRMRRGT